MSPDGAWGKAGSPELKEDAPSSLHAGSSRPPGPSGTTMPRGWQHTRVLSQLSWTSLKELLSARRAEQPPDVALRRLDGPPRQAGQRGHCPDGHESGGLER